MEIATFLISLVIFGEINFLLFRKYQPKRGGQRKIYVDTSALIDGRILNIARTGFITGDLIIPKGVLLELQLIADGKDSEKRNRARAGLETVSELERVVNINTGILDEEMKKQKVDEELLRLAKENRGLILTLDYNLIKVAEAERITTLNINDLALAIRNELFPGEKIKLKILEKGSGRGQGVGHLSDGTMVIVDGAAKRIGKELIVEIVKFHETSSGRIVFAKIAQRK